MAIRMIRYLDVENPWRSAGPRRQPPVTLNSRIKG